MRTLVRAAHNRTKIRWVRTSYQMNHLFMLIYPYFFQHFAQNATFQSVKTAHSFAKSIDFFRKKIYIL